MPKVSIVMTSFNHEKYLREAIDCVLNQTFTDYELIIWDDASTDGSWAIINSYSDSRIMAYRNEVTKRGAYGINKAISEIASGEYIAIHHSDDVWELNKLENQVAFLDAHPDVGATFTQVQLIDENGANFMQKGHPYLHAFDQPNRTRHEWLNHFFFLGNALCHPSVLIRKACYLETGLYDRRLGQITDLEMWVRLCMKYNIHILEKPLTRFRIRANEMNQSSSKPETHNRIRLESQQMLFNYLAISSEEELFAIFPDMRKTTIPVDNHIPFLLAHYAIDRGAPFHQAFGFSTLYEMMRDPATVFELEQKYGFSYPELIHIAGARDVFQFNELESLKQEVNRIKSTVSWRVTKPLRAIWNFLCSYLPNKHSR